MEIMMAMMAMMAMTVNSHDELAKSSVNSPCASRPSSRPPGPVSLGHPPPLPGWQGRLCWASDISDVEFLVVDSPEILGFDQTEPWKIAS